METLFKDIDAPLQFNMPLSQAGKIADVYYTVTRLDETGAPTAYIPKTQAGIIDSGTGSYTVILSFGLLGSYNIGWELENTPYVGNDSLLVISQLATVDNIDDLLNTRYSGIGL